MAVATRLRVRDAHSILRPDTAFWPGAPQVAFSTLTAVERRVHETGWQRGQREQESAQPLVLQAQQGPTSVQARKQAPFNALSRPAAYSQSPGIQESVALFSCLATWDLVNHPFFTLATQFW